ncbi:MAG: hypothetical protein IJ048_04435 [Clostridia bacterium]|nr:hypothetical protein [Clostridia bacterium]
MDSFARERVENGYPQPHNVKYWSIGNENWGIHEIGTKSMGEWGSMVREAAKMMIRVDPTIQISAASIADLNWNINLLRAAGPFLDWISIHDYWDGSPDGLHNADYNTVMLRTGDDLTRNIRRVRAFLTSLNLQGKIKVAYDEWNLRGWFHPNVMNVWDNPARREAGFREMDIIAPRGKNDINTAYTMADAVFSASFLNTCLKNCDLVKMACFSPAVNTRGAIYTYKDGLVLRPQYFVFDLYANLMKENVLSSWTDGVNTLSGVDNGKTKTVDSVDAVITCDKGGYAIGAVNKDPAAPQRLTLRILDDTVREMRVHTLNGLSPDAYNDIGHTGVSITVGPWTAFAGEIELPPHSVSVIELR